MEFGGKRDARLENYDLAFVEDGLDLVGLQRDLKTEIWGAPQVDNQRELRDLCDRYQDGLTPRLFLAGEYRFPRPIRLPHRGHVPSMLRSQSRAKFPGALRR